jgi:hypothetical protein
MKTYDDIANDYDEKKASGKEFEGLVPVPAKVKRNADIVYSVRFTQEEILAIDRKAQARGLKTSAFVREAALKEALHEDDPDAELAALKRELTTARDALDRASALV